MSPLILHLPPSADHLNQQFWGEEWPRETSRGSDYCRFSLRRRHNTGVLPSNFLFVKFVFLSAEHHTRLELIHASGVSHVWAETYNRDLSDVNSLQSELAQTIAKQVGATTSVSGKLERRIKPEAHDAYLLRRYYWFAFETEKSWEYFQKAIDLQPDYAAAWSGLSVYYGQSAVSGESRPEAVMPQGEAAAKKALELDDSVAEAHSSMAAMYFFYRWNWEAAERESARAVELNPSSAQAHHLRGYVLGTLNRTDEALQEQRKSMELDSVCSPLGAGSGTDSSAPV
jgi:tetratricopeptide (TPR) repeat protein